MGILEKDSSQIFQSIVAIEAIYPRRVLPQLWVPSQIRHSLAQRSGSQTVAPSAPETACDLWASGDLRAQCHLGSGRLSLVPASEGAAAGVDALGSETISLDAQAGTATAPPQSPHHRLSAPLQKAATQKADLWSNQTGHPVKTSHSRQDRQLGCSPTRLHRSRSGFACRQLCLWRLLSFAEPHRHPYHLGGDPCGLGQRARRSPSRHGNHPSSLTL